MAKRSRNRPTATGRISKTAAPGQASWFDRDWIYGLALVLAVFLVYQPVWHAGFVWDDDAHLTENPCIIGPFGLKEIWTTHAALICPLVLTAFWFEHSIWGLAPLPYHVVNVLEQGLCAIVLWRVLRSLQIPGAWLGAALWALHPVQVESVAWVSEMKNTQSTLFYLLAILFYVKWLKAAGPIAQKKENYAFILLFAALAMASKYSVAVLPAVLTLCSWWIRTRWNWRDQIGLLPVWAMSAIAIVATVWPQSSELAVESTAARSFAERLATSGDVIWFYLGKLIWPHPLIATYPRWTVNSNEILSYLPLVAAVAVTVVLWRKRNSWGRPWFFAWAYFLVALSPFLGLIDQSFWKYSFVQDHLQYLACMGPLALAGAGMFQGTRVLVPKKDGLARGIFAGVLLILGTLSWCQAWTFESDEALWTNTLAYNSNSWAGHDHLGVVLFQKGQTDEALEHLRQSVELNGNNSRAQLNLGNVLSQSGQLDEGIGHYQKALEIDPGNKDAHNNLGLVLLQKGQLDEAGGHFQKALEIDSRSGEAHNGLGIVLARKGRADDALAEFQKAVEVQPRDAEFRNNLGGILMQKGQLEEAIAQFQEALRLNPNAADAQDDLARAQAALKQR